MTAIADVQTSSRFDVVSIDKLKASPLQPRKHFDAVKLADLAASAKSKGILQPLLVRRNGGPGLFEILCGERRFRAAGLAGIKELPVIVRDLDDAAALEVITSEMSQGEPLTAMEEANTFQALLKLGKYDIPKLTAKIGRSEAYIYGRLGLLKLPQRVAKALEAGEIQAEHAQLISRLPKHVQDDALDVCLQETWIEEPNAEGEIEEREVTVCLPVQDFKTWISRNVYRRLKDVPWKLDDPTLTKAGPCTTCPSNTACQKSLFNESEKNGPQCEDIKCFDQKLDAHVKRQVKVAREKGEEVVLVSQERWDDAKKESDALGRRQWEETKPNARGAVKAFVEDGPAKGKQIFIKRSSNGRSSGGSTSAKAEPQKEKSPRPLAERMKELEKRRYAWVCQHLIERFDDEQKSFDLFCKTQGDKWHAQLFVLASTFGAPRDQRDGKIWSKFDQWLKDAKAAGQVLWGSVCVRFRECLRTYGLDHAQRVYTNHAGRLGLLMGIKLAELMSEASNAIPQPKSWAAESKPQTTNAKLKLHDKAVKPKNAKEWAKAQKKPKAKKKG